MKAHLTRRYYFSASHRLHNDSFSIEKNQAVYGKCNNPHGHGHNYALEVTVSGEVNSTTGMVCDLHELDAITNENVIGVFDQSNLSTLPWFQNTVPSTENLCITIFSIFSDVFKSGAVSKIRIEETSKNSFEYTGPDSVEN